MGSQWFRNMRGATLTDEEMKEIPHPTLELTLHISTKTIQAGGLLGSMLIAPIACLIMKDSRNLNALKHTAMRYGRNGIIIGAALGPLMTYGKIRNEEDPYKIWDRCYRLRYNRNQVRVDQMSVVGGAAGTAIGVASGACNGAMLGGVTGMVSGVLLAAIYNSTAASKE